MDASLMKHACRAPVRLSSYERMVRLLIKPRAALWIAVLAFVMSLPALAVGLSADDFGLGFAVRKEVFVRESSSYYQSLIELNARLQKEGKPPATITPAPEELEDEDLLEMANAGSSTSWSWTITRPGSGSACGPR